MLPCSRPVEGVVSQQLLGSLPHTVNPGHTHYHIRIWWGRESVDSIGHLMLTFFIQCLSSCIKVVLKRKVTSSILRVI